MIGITEVLYLLLAGILIVGALRGFYRLFSKINTYHKPISEYDPCIEISIPKAELEVDDTCLISSVNRFDFESSDHNEDIKIIGPDSKSDGEIFIDTTEKVKKYRGEDRLMKFLRLWFYTGVSVTITTVMAIAYLQIIVDLFDTGQVPLVELILAYILLIAVIYTGFRIASFLNFGDSDIDSSNFQDTVYSWMFSFNMTLLSLWVVSFFYVLMSGGQNAELIISGDELILILGAIVVISGVASFVSEGVLNHLHVDEELTETYIREEEKIDKHL